MQTTFIFFINENDKSDKLSLNDDNYSNNNNLFFNDVDFSDYNKFYIDDDNTFNHGNIKMSNYTKTPNTAPNNYNDFLDFCIMS